MLHGRGNIEFRGLRFSLIPNPSSSSEAQSSAEPISSSEAISSSSSELVSSSEYSSSSQARGNVVFKNAPVYTAVYDSAEDDYLPSLKGRLSYLTDSNYGDIRAFVSINSFLDLMVTQEYELTLSSAGLTYEFSGSIGTFSISTDGDCSFTNLSALGGPGLVYPLDIGDSSKGGNQHTAIYDVSISHPDLVTYSLGDYSLPYYLYEDDAYLPTSVVSAFFLYGLWSSITWNGTNFYYTDDCTKLRGGDWDGRSAFGKSYYETSTMIDSTTKSQTVAELDANSFLFTLDMSYGFIEEERFADGYGSFLQTEYPSVYEGLYSTDVETVLTSYDYVVNTLMGDGHSALYAGNTGIGSFYNEGEHSVNTSKTPPTARMLKLNADYSRINEARRVALNLGSTYSLGDHYLEISGDTAIIRFDSFVAGLYDANLGDEFYESHVSDDVFSLFYTCYRKIEETGGVKNVIVDVTCNPGGDSVALVAGLGFMVDNPAINVYENASKTSFSATYRTDCNADGVITEGESPANDYNQYVLTSAFSFSCANAFPHYAKANGLKTIGATSGGGGYAVYPIMLGDGYPIRISGPISLGRGSLDEPSIDTGVTPDIEIPESDYYDIDKLRAAITA
ncbi:MAG: S41 family peptidase [Bacillota bacterium]|nr:S41 family peptidase [Bacillota bacterium]